MIEGRPAAAIRNVVTLKRPRLDGVYNPRFTLKTGSYECTLAVADSSGQVCCERMLFDVK